MEVLKKLMLRIVKMNPDGFTFNPVENRFPFRGYAVATHATQDCVGKTGLFRVIKFCLKHQDYCIGGWKNENGTIQFDASKIYPTFQEAISAAIANKQRAIFNLHTGKVILECNFHNYLDTDRAAA